MVQNGHNWSRKNWATCSSVRSLTHSRAPGNVNDSISQNDLDLSFSEAAFRPEFSPFCQQNSGFGRFQKRQDRVSGFGVTKAKDHDGGDPGDHQEKVDENSQGGEHRKALEVRSSTEGLHWMLLCHFLTLTLKNPDFGFSKMT